MCDFRIQNFGNIFRNFDVFIKMSTLENSTLHLNVRLVPPPTLTIRVDNLSIGSKGNVFPPKLKDSTL